MSAELEQFCILAKNQKGRACAALIQQVISHKKIYVFRELLEIPSVIALRETEHEKALNTLELFAYGSIADFLELPEKYIDLNDFQKSKLKQLSLISLAKVDKIISYKTLQEKLYIDSIRSLEDLIIETMYAGLIRGKLDQRAGIFRIKEAMGRDVRPEWIDSLIETLVSWSESADALLHAIDESSNTVQMQRDSDKARNESMQHEIESVKTLVREGAYSEELGRNFQSTSDYSFGSMRSLGRVPKRGRGFSNIAGGHGDRR